MDLKGLEMGIVSGPCTKCGAQKATDRRIILILCIVILAGITIEAVKIMKDYRQYVKELSNLPDDSMPVNKNIVGEHIIIDSDTTQSLLVKAGIIDGGGWLVGTSMQPTIYEGNTLLTRKVYNDTKLVPGMVIRYTTLNTTNCSVTFTSPIPYVVHRIDAIYNDNIIITSGDNNRRSEAIRRCQITHIIAGVIYT